MYLLGLFSSTYFEHCVLDLVTLVVVVEYFYKLPDLIYLFFDRIEVMGEQDLILDDGLPNTQITPFCPLVEV
jgi:hypothetical protein